MVMALVFVIAHPNLLEPLDAPSTDIAGDDDPYRMPVIRGQWNVVHELREDHVVARVHGVLQRYAGLVSALARLIGASKIDPQPLVFRPCFRYVRCEKDVPEAWALPVGAADHSSAPAEALGAFDQVELLSSVAIARQGNRYINGVEIVAEPVHGQLQLSTFDFEDMRLPQKMRHRTTPEEALAVAGKVEASLMVSLTHDFEHNDTHLE